MARLIVSKGVKQIFPVNTIMSLEKRSFIMISSFCGASPRDSNNICTGHLNNLLCGVKRLCMTRGYADTIGLNVVRSQNLEGTQFNCGQLKYDYKGGITRVHLGRFEKSVSLSNSNRNVVSLSSVKRNFSTEKSNNSKNFKIYKGKYVNLIEVVANIDFLQGAYQKIKFSPGVMIKRSSEERFDGLNSNWFEKTSERILNGSFCFMRARRLIISKSNKSVLRPLIISNSRDKIVQQAMKMVLEHIYDSLLFDTSYDFRSFRGCHSALESIHMNWTGISWFLKFDVEKHYDTIDRQCFVSIVREKIDDQRFIDLIFKLFDVGIISWKERLDPSPLEGVAQRSAVYSILVNIYLHKLDVEVANITKEYQKGKIRRKDLKAFNVKCCEYRRKVFKFLPPEKQAVIMTKHRADRCKVGVNMTDWNDPSFVRIKYVRYVNDLLFGIAGSKDLVTKIRDRILFFSKSYLKVNLIGGEITHIGAGKVKFLGMWIRAVLQFKFPARFGKASEKKKRMKNRFFLQKKTKEERLLKVTRCALLKVLKDKRTRNINVLEAREKVEALKFLILQIPEFSKEWGNIYSQFLQVLVGTIMFVPEHLKKDLNNLKFKIFEWEKMLIKGSVDSKKIDKEQVSRYDVLSHQIEAPLIEVREKLKQKGLISNSNKPKAIRRLIRLPDDLIIKWYTLVGRGLINYYRCCRNFYKVKYYVNYMVRWSGIHTLAGKHKFSSRKIIAKYTKDLIMKDQEGFVITQFLSTQKIRTMGRKFLFHVSRDARDKVIDQT